MASSMACSPVNWPSACAASSVTAALRSDTTSAKVLVETEPRRILSRYMSRRAHRRNCNDSRMLAAEGAASAGAASDRPDGGGIAVVLRLGLAWDRAGAAAGEGGVLLGFHSARAACALVCGAGGGLFPRR